MERSEKSEPCGKGYCDSRSSRTASISTRCCGQSWPTNGAARRPYGRVAFTKNQHNRDMASRSRTRPQGRVLLLCFRPCYDAPDEPALARPIRQQLHTPMKPRTRRSLSVVIALFLSAGVARADVTRVDIKTRADVGLSGYEKIIGTIHFAVDPNDP